MTLGNRIVLVAFAVAVFVARPIESMADAVEPHSGHELGRTLGNLYGNGLGGAPGVRSARFSGEDADDQSNNDLLLQQLQHEGK